MITVYHLDKEGKVTAKGEREDDFDLDRLKKKRVTAKEKPEAGKNETVRFNFKKDEWEVIPDYRNKTYLNEKGKEVTIEKITVVYL